MSQYCRDLECQEIYKKTMEMHREKGAIVQSKKKQWDETSPIYTCH